MKYTDGMKNLKAAFEACNLFELGEIKRKSDDQAIKTYCEQFYVTPEELLYVLEDAIETISGIWN